MDKAFVEDWCSSAFRDLALCQHLCLEELTPLFADYRPFFCQQAIEKYMKALLIKRKQIFNNDDLRSYNHDFTKMLKSAELGEKEKTSVVKTFSKIGKEFYEDFGLQTEHIKLDISKKFKLEEIISGTNTKLNFYSFFLEVLDASYQESRYPKSENLQTSARFRLNNDDIYLNYGLVIATIKSCKAIIKLINDPSSREASFMNFTWTYQSHSFDQASRKTIQEYLHTEELFNYLYGKTNHLFINEYFQVIDL